MFEPDRLFRSDLSDLRAGGLIVDTGLSTDVQNNTGIKN